MIFVFLLEIVVRLFLVLVVPPSLSLVVPLFLVLELCLALAPTLVPLWLPGEVRRPEQPAVRKAV